MQSKATYYVILVDIGIGVVSGASPIPNISPDTPASGLLQVNSAHTGPKQMSVNAMLPYLYLPSSTCQAITARLPVFFNDDLALYIWNTSHPSYKNIVSSPTYLSFTFTDPSSVTNATIKVPFALLNLTLLPPLAQTPTPYFPCRPYDSPADARYWLGRAFLQQAYFGVGWQTLTMYLAQAPGPNISSSTIQPWVNPLQTSEVSWEDTWTGHLKPLVSNPTRVESTTVSSNIASTGNVTPGNASTNNATAISKDSPLSLSAGAKVGIGVGVAFGLIVVAALGVSLRSSRRLRQPSEEKEVAPRASTRLPPCHEIDSRKGGHEMDDKRNVSELPHQREPVELE